MASETTQSNTEPPSSDLVSDTEDAPLSTGSPKPAGVPIWTEVPVSHVPAGWPTGPRELPPRRYVCPHKDCEDPVGPRESWHGWDRYTLGHHIYHSPGHGMHEVRKVVRDRVNALRVAEGREKRGPLFLSEDEDWQEQMDSLILDLEEIKDWELASRHQGDPLGGARDAWEKLTRNLREGQGFSFELVHEWKELGFEADQKPRPNQNSHRAKIERLFPSPPYPAEMRHMLQVNAYEVYRESPPQQNSSRSRNGRPRAEQGSTDEMRRCNGPEELETMMKAFIDHVPGPGERLV